MAGMKGAECHCITNSAAPMPAAFSFHTSLQRATTDSAWTGNVPSAGAVHRSGVTQMETHSGMVFDVITSLVSIEYGVYGCES
jgi:hypothetical protein